jgi:photosystem II stability/assembly factor-like uncharacterized protein
MTRFLPLAFFLFLISLQGWTQTWTRMQSWGLDFESIHWINGQDGVIVGERLIIRTTDGGITWQEVLQKFDSRLKDVVFLDGTKGVAVGEKGTILITMDKGISWEKRPSGSTADLFSVSKFSATELIAVGQNGEILLSSDAGMTWQKSTAGTASNLNDVTVVNPNLALVAADEGKILKSTDKGKTWTTLSINKTNDLFGIAFSSELNGFVVGENGLIERTANGGSTWTALNSATTTTLRKVQISPLDVRIAIAVGDVATIVRTTNTGTTFAKINLGATATRRILDIGFKPNSNETFTAGQDGYLLFSGNAGAGWTQRLAGIRNRFSSVDFKNQTTGFIAGENGAVFVTTNSATALISRPIPESIPILSIDFWNTGFGYSSSPGGKNYRTGNSGSNWAQVFDPSTKAISGFYLFAPSVLYAAGSGGYITRSFDSGGTWDQGVISNTTANLKDVTFFDFVFGFAIGDNGQISWSAGGNEWQNLPKLTTENLNALAKLDTTKALIVGNGGVILKTEDKARTWRKIESGTTKNLTSIDFFDQKVGFIAGEGGLALVSLDGGETWTNSPTGTIRDFTSVSAGTDTRAYFVGEDGSILSYSCIPPTGSLGAIQGDFRACLSSAVYSINESPQAGSEIVWRVDGGQIVSGQGTNSIEVNWTNVGRNAVLVSRSNFCGSGETSALEVSVSQIPPSNLTITGEGSVCREKTHPYSLPNLEETTYTWLVIGGEVTQGQGTRQVQIKWNLSGDQRISVTLENRCGKSEPILKSVVVSSPPAQPSTIRGEIQTGLGEQIYEIERLPGLDYRWAIPELSGKIISGQGTGRIVVSWEKEGDFELSVEAQNQCDFGPKRILAVNVNIITALEPDQDPSLKLYPNPSLGALTVTSASLDTWSSLSVINSVGQLILSQDIRTGQKELTLSGLPRGLLLIQLQGKNGLITRKILVR